MHQPPGNPREKDYHTRLRKVLAFIQENLSDDLSLDKLSGIANFSPFHFQKIFSQYIGESPKQYIIRLRLERIAHYLKLYPELSISEASFQCGFASPSTFIRAFKKFYGKTPEAFRKLSLEEISKIGTLKPNNGKLLKNTSSEFWSPDLMNMEDPGSIPELKIDVVSIRSLKVAFIDTHLGDEDAISNAFHNLARWAGPRELISRDTKFIGILLDMPFFTDLGKCRYRACITLPEDYPLPKDTVTDVIPGGKYATFTMKGSIRSVFSNLRSFSHGWLPGSGYQVAGITGFEEFPVNPASGPMEEIPRQLFIPVKPA